jgi:hypothetical protein
VPAGRGAGQQQHHHHQQQQRGLSAAGDERRPDQDAMCYSDAHSAALMVSLAAWAPGPPQPPAAPPAAAALPAAHQQQRPAQRADAAMVGRGWPCRGRGRDAKAAQCVHVGWPLIQPEATSHTPSTC